MKAANCLLIPALFISKLIWAQDEKIVSEEPFFLHDSIFKRINIYDTAVSRRIEKEVMEKMISGLPLKEKVSMNGKHLLTWEQILILLQTKECHL